MYSSPVAAQAEALAVLQQEDQRRLLLHVHLGVISGVGQFPVARQHAVRSARAPPPRRRAGQARPARGMPAASDPRTGCRTAPAVCAAVRRTPCPWCCRRDRFPPPGRRPLRRTAGRAARRAVRAPAAPPGRRRPPAACYRRAAHFHLARLVFRVENPGVVHFREIVIFGGQPEDRNGRNSVGGQPLRPVSRRAEPCKWCSRAGKQPHLLAGHYRHCPGLRQPFERRAHADSAPATRRPAPPGAPSENSICRAAA